MLVFIHTIFRGRDVYKYKFFFSPQTKHEIKDVKFGYKVRVEIIYYQLTVFSFC